MRRRRADAAETGGACGGVDVKTIEKPRPVRAETLMRLLQTWFPTHELRAATYLHETGERISPLAVEDYAEAWGTGNWTGESSPHNPARRCDLCEEPGSVSEFRGEAYDLEGKVCGQCWR